MFTVVKEDGYIKVKRGKQTICAGTDLGDHRIANIEFLDPKDQKNNRTRQAAMRELQKAGYK